VIISQDLKKQSGA